MKRINLLLIVLLGFFVVNAQTVNDVDNQFLDKIKFENNSIKSITSNFRQVKHMSILGEDMVSDGKLYYIKPAKMAMAYNEPKGDLMVINEDRFIMVMSGKRHETTAKSNAKMRGIKAILTASLEGDVRQLEADKIKCSETKDSYIIIVDLIKGKSNKSGIEQIVVSYDKKNYTLSALRMNEKDGTYTNYELIDKKLNNSVDDTVFQ